MWGYLAEFWDSVAEVVIGGVTYTVDWFESIGNAVAGAVGNLFEGLFRHINDAFVFLGWTGEILKELFAIILMPLEYLYNFFAGLFGSFTTDPITPDFTIPGSQYYSAIPYFTEIMGVIGLGIALFITFKTIKQLSSL